MHISSHQILKITKAGFQAVEKASMPIQDRLLLSETKKPIVVKDLYLFSKRQTLDFQAAIQKFYLNGWLKIYDKMEDISQTEATSANVNTSSETQTLKDNDLEFTNDLGNILEQIQKAQEDLKKLNDEQEFLNSEIVKTQSLTKPNTDKVGVKKDIENEDSKHEELSFLEDLDLEKSKTEAEEERKIEDEENKKTESIDGYNKFQVIEVDDITLGEQIQQQQINRQKERALKEQLVILQRMQNEAEAEKRKRETALEKKKRIEDEKKLIEEKKRQEILERQKVLNEQRLKSVGGLSAYLKKIEQDKKKK